MKTVESVIEVNAPVSEVYNQWTQFEEFPKFMGHVEEVKQLDDTHLHWVAKIAGKTKEWDAVIKEQEPDTKIEWFATHGADNRGIVTFDKIGQDKTKVTLKMAYDPKTFIEELGAKVGIFEDRVEQDLESFKELIESRGEASGAWRKEVHAGEVGPAGQALERDF